MLCSDFHKLVLRRKLHKRGLLADSDMSHAYPLSFLTPKMPVRSYTAVSPVLQKRVV